MSNGDDYPGLSTARSNGEISPLELESLAANGDDSSSYNNKNSGKNPMGRLASNVLPRAQMQQLMMLLRLYFELYPKVMMGMTGGLLALLLMWWSPWSGNVTRNYMTRDYTALEDNFNFQTAQIDHWCLFGGDDRCYCEDPTEAMGREEVKGWAAAHQRNKLLTTQSIGYYGGTGVDVVFIGDQTIQAWDGKWLDRSAPEGLKIAKYFNDTFRSDDSQFVGLALGIYGDRINNILWRIQHGEVPQSLNPKVFWLIMGTNDLALGLCSEEVVTLGIMRIAEELHHHYPETIIVIQGILPRSNHRDGSLEGKTSKKATRGGDVKTPHKWLGAGTPSIGSAHKADPSGGTTYDPSFPNGVRRLLQQERYYNPIDQFLDEYHNHCNDTTKTQQLLEDLWAPHVEGNGFFDSDIAQEELGRRGYRKLEGTDDDSTTITTTKAPVKGITSGTTGTPEAEAKATSGGSVMTSPKRPYKYEDSGKILPTDNKARLPKFDFYLWPSIKAINKELEGFCEKHEHLVYFDADDLVLGSIGNKHYRTGHKSIIKELMPNYVHLSFEGQKVVMDVINNELKRIIYDDDEKNDIETQN